MFPSGGRIPLEWISTSLLMSQGAGKFPEPQLLAALGRALGWAGEEGLLCDQCTVVPGSCSEWKEKALAWASVRKPLWLAGQDCMGTGHSTGLLWEESEVRHQRRSFSYALSLYPLAILWGWQWSWRWQSRLMMTTLPRCQGDSTVWRLKSHAWKTVQNLWLLLPQSLFWG